MERKIGVAEARESFSDLVNRAAYGNERFVVERRGKPLVALISATEYRQFLDLLSREGVSCAVHGVPARLRFDGERYFVSADDLDLYGVGDTPEEAREDLWMATQDYYTDLATHADTLASHMQLHLALLRPLFAQAEGDHSGNG